MRYRFGDHTLDVDTLQLLAGGNEVEVEPQVFSVLAHLVRHHDRVVPKEELLDEIWGSRFVSESALTTRIKQVRRAVGDSGRDQRVVKTFHGRGYRLVAEVEQLAATTSPPPWPTAVTQPPGDRAPPTRYADSHDASIAFQTFGEGPDLVLIAGFATNVEAQWDHPLIAAFLTRLGRFARVTVLDKRGVGLSDRMPFDSAPSLETRADDLATVLDTAGIARATILGSSEGGSLSAVFAASHPERVERLVLHATWVTGPNFPDVGISDLDLVLERWGTGRIYAYLGPSLARDARGREIMARYERQSASPRTARHLLELIGQIDIGGILGAISVPTLVIHRAGDTVVPLAHGRRLAAAIPGARLVVVDGHDHYLFSGDPSPTLAAVEDFIAGTPVDDVSVDRTLATVLVVELVAGTAPAAATERRHARHVARFHAAALDEVNRHSGVLVPSGGDGVLATFDGPGRAVRAAAALRDAVGRLDLTVRAGLHTAEIQRRGDDIAGVGVQIACAVAGAAAAGEVWVSRTVTDLVAGTGLRFEPRGEWELDGVDAPWMLFAALV